MKLRFSLLFGLFILVFSSAHAIVDRPTVPRLVNDFGGVLTPAEEDKLETKLVAFDDSTSTQISIVSIVSLEGQDVSSYAFELGEKWGIGQQGKDNGILFLIAVEDRKMFIAPGYGLEGVVTDLACKRIVEGFLKPNFRSGNFYQGLDEGTDAVIGLATGEFTADHFRKRKGNTGWLVILFLVVFFLIPFVLMYHYVRYNNSNISSRKGGFWGSLYTGAAVGSGSSSFGNFSSGSGSFSSGGFGGFGGGSFGGGGAGGGW